LPLTATTRVQYTLPAPAGDSSRTAEASPPLRFRLTDCTAESPATAIGGVAEGRRDGPSGPVHHSSVVCCNRPSGSLSGTLTGTRMLPPCLTGWPNVA
jgi:hypothetical protein